MLKFIRKYNKILLVGFGVFLMISFLAPAGIQQCSGDPRDRVVATVAGRPVTVRAMALAAAEREAARAFLYRTSAVRQGGLLQSMAGMGGFGDLLISQDEYTEIVNRVFNGSITMEDYPAMVGAQMVENFVGENNEHWFLLTEQAKALGFVGGPEDGRDWLLTLAAGSPDVQALLETLRADAARRSGLTLEQADAMMSKIQGVAKSLEMYAKVAPPSDRSMKVKAKDALESVSFDYVVIPGGHIGKTLPPPDEAALLAHFERFKDVKAQDGEFGIGYVRPARVKIEWLKVDRAQIESLLFISPVLIEEEYRENTTQYPGEKAEALALVEQVLREETADVLVREAERVLRGAVQPTIDRLPADGAYRALPADWQRPDLEALAARVDRVLRSEGEKPSPRWRLVRERTGEGLAPIVTVTRRDATWLTARDLSQLEGIGTGGIRLGGRQVSFPQAVLMTRELPQPEQRRVNREDLAIQIGVPVIDRPVVDAAGNEYFFTVLDVRPESAADSLDEVRPTVAEDYRSLAAFEQLRKETEQIRSLALSDGLNAIVELYKGEVEENQPAPVAVKQASGQRASVPVGELNTEEFRKALFEKADEIDPVKPIEEFPLESRLIVQELPKSRSIAVVRITGIAPATIERFRSVGEIQARRLEGQAVAKGGEPFTAKKLRERLQFVSKSDRPGRDEDAGEESTD